MDNQKKYSELFENIDLKKGDTVYIASDALSLIMHFKEIDISFEPNVFIDTIIDIVGVEGTILFPTYNWDFCKGKIFDYKKTISECGSLSNIALNRHDFKRTKHPIYSFAVYGKHQDYLCSLENKTSWGKDSPFHFLFKNSKNLFIGIDYKDGFTMDHYFEQLMNVEYRFNKDFTSIYLDENGLKQKKTYSMFVRNLDIVDITKINPKLDEVLIKNDALKINVVKKIMFSLIYLDKAGEIIIDDLKSGGNYIYPLKY